MELPFEFCENKNWLFYLIEKWSQQQIVFQTVSQNISFSGARGDTGFWIINFPQGIVIDITFDFPATYDENVKNSYPELEIAEPTGDLGKFAVLAV